MKFPLGPRVKVEVTQDTIQTAIAANSNHCWIAESIKAALPHASGVAVDVSTTRFTDPEKGLRYVYLTPLSAQLALIDFDEGNPPAPFSFILKNAHVTRAGTLPRNKELREQAKDSRDKKKAARAARDAALTTARLVGGPGHGHGNLPRRVGGKRPPQLRTMRQFGVRAFRGASKKRLEADVALTAEADTKKRD